MSPSKARVLHASTTSLPPLSGSPPHPHDDAAQFHSSLHLGYAAVHQAHAKLQPKASGRDQLHSHQLEK